MQELFRTPGNSRRFLDADLETLEVFTTSDMTGFAAGDVVIDYQGLTQTILEISPLPAGLTRIVLARL